MFLSKMKKRPKNDDEYMQTSTTLAEGMTIKDGNLYGLSGVTISGVFFGDIDIEGTLIITESGNLKGNIKADEVLVYGTVEGNISTRGKVHIYSESRVTGEIAGMSLIVEEGAAFKGMCNTAFLQTTNILKIAGTIPKQQEAPGSESLPVMQAPANTESWNNHNTGNGQPR